MRNTIKSLLGVIAMLAVTLGQSEAATYSPVLGDLLSGNATPSSSGAFNPFDIYNTDYVTMNVATDSTNSSVVNLGAGAGFNNGDTLSVVSAFAGLSSQINVGATNALGAGYGALIWNGTVTGGGSGSGSTGSFDITNGGNGVQDILSNASTTDFLTLVVSETVDFANSTLSEINDGLAAGTDTVFEIATFNLSNSTQEFAYSAVGGGFANTELTATGLFSLDVSTTAPGVQFWSLQQDGVQTVGNVSYPFGSNGSELWLNYRFSNNINFDEDVSSAAAGTYALLGSGAAAMNAVPEPSSMLAIAGCVGFAGLVSRRRKRRKQA